MKEMELYIDFDEYIRQGEPGQQEKSTTTSLPVIRGISAMRWYVPTTAMWPKG